MAGSYLVPGSAPFRLTAWSPPEDDLQASVADAFDKLMLPPAMWFALPIGHVKLTPAQAARLARIGVKRGLPDLLVIHQGVYGIELKREGGRLSATRTIVVRDRRGNLRERVLDGQREVFPRLLAAGFQAIGVARSVDEALDQLAAWKVPLRPFTGRVA